jgi:hypothetical protein
MLTDGLLLELLGIEVSDEALVGFEDVGTELNGWLLDGITLGNELNGI